MSPGEPLAEFDFPAFFDRLSRLTLRSRKRVTGEEHGGRLSTKKGRGLEPVGYREYEPGDPVQLVDWTAYARTEKLFVREYEEERALQTHVLLDVSSSMGFGGKLALAGKMAAGICFLAREENEAFGLSTFTDEVVPGEVERGRLHLMDVVDRVSSVEAEGETDLFGALSGYQARLRSRGLIVVVSDFMDGLESVKDAVNLLGEHDLVFIQVVSEEEVEPGYSGKVRLVDSETEEEMEMTFTEEERRGYSRLVRRHSAELGREVRKVEGDHVPFSSSRPALEAMFDLISRRMNRSSV